MNYQVIKSKRSKYSRVRIRPNGEVIITVPWYYTKADIDKTYLKFLPWINKHMEKAIDESLKKDISNNGFIYILGTKTKINLINDSINSVILDGELYVHYCDLNKVPKLIDDFITDLRNKTYKEILDKYLLVTGFKLKDFVIKDLKSTYGRCYKDLSKIVIAKSNIHKRYEFIEAVIVHEICHLKESNHKKDFYDLVYQYYPNYKEEIKRRIN